MYICIYVYMYICIYVYMYLCIYIYICIYTSTIFSVPVLTNSIFSQTRRSGRGALGPIRPFLCPMALFLGPRIFKLFLSEKIGKKKCLIFCRELLMYKPRFRGTPHAKYANAYFIQCRINDLKAIICDRGASNSRSLSRTRETGIFRLRENRGPPV